MSTISTPVTFDLAGIKRQLQQLQELNSTGALSDEALQDGRIKLERRILDWALNTDISQNPAPQPQAAPPPNGKLIAILGASVVAIAAAGYFWMGSSSTGNPDVMGGAAESGVAASPDGSGSGKPHATNFDQIAAMTEKLASRLKDNPEDSEGWAMLARSYNVLGRNPEALAAYEKALALRNNDAVLLADYADALALKNGRNLDGEPMKMVDRALKIEPKNLKALSLAGTNAFQKKDYAGAVKYWEQVIQVGPPNNSLVEQVLPALTEARELAGLPPIDRLATVGKAPTPPIGLTLTGTVTLASALAQDAKPDDTVFIFARAVDGSRMPLAILQKKVKDLPFKFTLDDSMAMSPESTLSKAVNVTVGARISKSGNAMPQKGDLTGQSAAVPAGAKDVAIEIKETVKQ